MNGRMDFDQERQPLRYNLNGLAREILLRTAQRKYLPGTGEAYYVAQTWTDPSGNHEFHLGAQSYGGPYTLMDWREGGAVTQLYAFGERKPVEFSSSEEKLAENIDPSGLHYRLQGILQMSGATTDSLPETSERRSTEEAIAWHAGRLSVMSLLNMDVMDQRRQPIGELLAALIDGADQLGADTAYDKLHNYARQTLFQPPNKHSFASHLDAVIQEQHRDLSIMDDSE